MSICATLLAVTLLASGCSKQQIPSSAPTVSVANAEEFLRNRNAANVPRFLHVSRWASMTCWAALFRAPAFSQLNAHRNEHFAIAVNAFLKAE